MKLIKAGNKLQIHKWLGVQWECSRCGTTWEIDTPNELHYTWEGRDDSVLVTCQWCHERNRIDEEGDKL